MCGRFTLHWEKADQVVERCTITVTSANDLTEDFHVGMPVILDRAALPV
jgi:putative SOS response-associated peptidase YedK